MNIIKEFDTESKKIKGCIQCYDSSEIIFNTFKNYNRLKEKRIIFKNKIEIVKHLKDIINFNNFVSKIEIRIYSNKTMFKKIYPFTQSEHNFIFKKNRTRLFVHSFNIIKYKQVIIAQSWFKKQPYHVIYKLTSITPFLNLLEKELNNFLENPAGLFNLFKYEDSIKTLSNFIENEIKNILIEFVIKYKSY